jgi:dihydrofolate reductase
VVPAHSPRLSLIAAVAANGVIGRNNGLPWHLPEDLKRFKAITMGRPVIMGRKTFDSIVAMLGKPLPGRTNIVISRSAALQGTKPEWDNVLPAATLEQAIAAAGEAAEVFIIGGAQIYALSLPRAQRLYLTEVKAEVEGDAYFPAREPARWQETSREPGIAASGPAYDFAIYDRR